MSDRVIRPAGPEDAGIVFGFIAALAAYEREPDAVETNPERLAEQMAREHPPFECLILEDGGRPAGIALFFHNYSTWRGRQGIYLEDLFVDPAMRGRGHGLALLRELGAIAVARGCVRMEWACLEWNEPAKDFYASLGARSLDDWRIWRLADDELEALATMEEGS
jgi:GNAT superfamily N-acetyltransferase